MEAANRSAGFFGKVASHGDFVSRRLPASFLDVWDQWLQQGLNGSRARLGADWHDAYMTGPVWRFALTSGTVDADTWFGVLMPSVDRVGRNFPLTIAAGTADMPGAAPLLDWLQESAGWYDDVERLALSTLQDCFTLENFDKGVSMIGSITPIAQMPCEDTESFMICDDAQWLPLSAIANAAARLHGLQQQRGAHTLDGHSMWWSDGSERVRPCLLACRGLPSENQFTSMLDRQWAASSVRATA